jgi:UPF0716 protein FxsA
MNPLSLLFLLLILVPMVEIYFLIQVGSVIGAIPTIALVIFTALLGAMLLRFQGLSTLARTRLAMAQGQVPATAMLEGVLLVFAGVLLLIPGFVTDALGFALLVPPLRQALVHWFIARAGFGSGGRKGAPRQPRQNHTIEGEFRRDDD